MLTSEHQGLGMFSFSAVESSLFPQTRPGPPWLVWPHDLSSSCCVFAGGAPAINLIVASWRYNLLLSQGRRSARRRKLCKSLWKPCNDEAGALLVPKCCLFHSQDPKPRSDLAKLGLSFPKK